MTYRKIYEILKSITDSLKLTGLKFEYFNDKFYITVWKDNSVFELFIPDEKVDISLDEKEIGELTRWIRDKFQEVNLN